MKSLNTSIRRDKKAAAFVPRRNSGFTLIEVLVVFTIFTFIVGFGWFVTMDFMKSYSFRSERTIAVSVLRKARTLSLINANQAPHGVRIEPKKYTIFEGAVFNPASPLNEIIDVQSSITMTCSPACPRDIVFSQLEGSVAVPVSITIGDGVRLAVISVNSEGRIDW